MYEYVGLNATVPIVEIEKVTLLAGSGVTGDGIDFGGVDINGDLEPSAPELLDLEEPDKLFE